MIQHGHKCRGAVTPTYHSWQSMKTRCDNPRRKRYHDWGGRGISYDPKWAVFENFLADMGERPPGATLDRRENDKGYNKSNCRWATRSQQECNKRMRKDLVVYRGKTAREWASVWGCITRPPASVFTNWRQRYEHRTV